MLRMGLFFVYGTFLEVLDKGGKVGELLLRQTADFEIFSLIQP